METLQRIVYCSDYQRLKRHSIAGKKQTWFKKCKFALIWKFTEMASNQIVWDFQLALIDIQHVSAQ